MRKITLTAALLAAMSLLILGQMACQPAPDTNRSAVPTANTNSDREVVDTAAIEAELLRIENDWPRVVREKDVAAAGRVEADDAVFIYPDGSKGNKEQDLKDIGSGAMTADSIEIRELQVKVLDKDAAVVIGHNVLKNGKYKMPDGKTMDISGEYRFVDTFARRNGEWKLVAGAATRIMAPAASASPAAKASPAASTAASPRPSATVRTPATATPRVTPTP
ncbi:MAG: nuclear transport factor 2 family protein [Pyrinomonadaceae bacterium]